MGCSGAEFVEDRFLVIAVVGVACDSMGISIS